MTADSRWHDATLYDLKGKPLGRLRVPRHPMPPGIIQWGGRFFMLALPDGAYMETQCYIAAVERVYPMPAPAAGLPFRKADK